MAVLGNPGNYPSLWYDVYDIHTAALPFFLRHGKPYFRPGGRNNCRPQVWVLERSRDLVADHVYTLYHAIGERSCAVRHLQIAVKASSENL